MNPLVVPSNERETITFASDLIEQCRCSVGIRTAYCRTMNAIAETGRYDGVKSLLNLLYKHLERTAAHLFSPVELKFAVDFDREYPQAMIDRGQVVGKQVTRHWDRKNIDIMFGRGVFDSLKYGATILKQWPQVEGHGDNESVDYYAKLVMPWQFGVYNESENSLSRQYAMCETTTMTLPEIWRRIWHRPDAKRLFDRVKSNSRKGEALSDPTSFFHQVLSTSQLNTGIQGATRPMPGGIVQLNNDPNYAMMGPQVAADVVQVHELWVQDGGDYTTIILIEPDVLIAPYGKRSNLLGIEGCHPYSLVQPNEVTNWFWGRSELVDLIEPQGLLSTWCDDLKRLTGLQVDKILAFIGETGITDEIYGQFRNAGYTNLPSGSQVTDLTPKMPPELLQMIKFVIDAINVLSGFPDIMRGQGEAGVRAGVHADTLLKTASPTLRDRALLVERQCAVAADLTLTIKEAKEDVKYWTKGDTLENMRQTEFLLTDLAEDWRVTVDSHSSSPIFSDENAQLLFALRRQGDVDGEFLLDNLPVPNKEAAKAGLARRQKAQSEQMAALMKANPEMGEKVMLRSFEGGRSR